MSPIYYSKNKDGSEIGRWNGKSIRLGNKVTKDKQIYLGKVVDKEKLIFFTKEEGFYRFDPDSQEKVSISDSEVPPKAPLLDKRLKERNVIVTFGGSYFLHELLSGIGYDQVLDSITLKKPDTMYALLHYYVLTDMADCNAFKWYQNSYARFLYPQANLSSQRISDFYVTFGSNNNRRDFFKGHIRYLKDVTNDEYAILVDSTGCQNACHIPITKISRHNNEINNEFRVVLVVQRLTGLPVYYEIIPGNVVDSSTISRILRLMSRYGFKITQVFGDAAYSCPANIEKVIFCGKDLVMRLNPTYDLYASTLNDHIDELTLSTFDVEHDIAYRNRVVRIIKVRTKIGTDKDSKDVMGYVYLCRDHQAYHSKSDHYMTHHSQEAGSAEVIVKTCEKYGVFAIITSKEYDEKDVIAVYYLRQAIEQFFDFAKNYGKMMPVRNHNLETINGHMLMSFITTFLAVAIKNRMNILDIPFVSVPRALKEHELHKMTIDGKEEYIDEQEPDQTVFRSNPAALFFSLNFVGADVFDNESDGCNQIIPSVPYKDANDYFKAFGLYCPEAVLIGKDNSLSLVIKNNRKNHCKKKKVFATRPFASQETIRKELEQKASKESISASDTAESSENQEQNVPKKRGRPKGSKNKKTLAREAELATQGLPATPVRRKRGRPVGSKDSKPRKRRKNNQ